jgi:hypothetical protein
VERDRVSHQRGRGARPTVQSTLIHLGRDGSRRKAQQPPNWECDREQLPGPILHRGCTRSFVTSPAILTALLEFTVPYLQSCLESRSRRRAWASICSSRGACSPQAVSPFRVRSSIRGRRTARVSSIQMHPRLCAWWCVLIPLGLYDVQYAERTGPECRGRLRTDEEGKYGYRAIVPVPYVIPDDGVGRNFLHCSVPLVTIL